MRDYANADPAVRAAHPAKEGALPWSWRLGQLAGIDLYVHPTFLLLLVFAGISGFAEGRGASGVARSVLFTVAVFATIVLHELGHSLTARQFDVRTLDITLLPIGGVARFEKMPESPGAQLMIALAGPVVNLIIAAVLFVALTFISFPDAIDRFAAQLLLVNVSLAGFNLLPAYPMDGGRVLRALLAMRMAPEAATMIAARVGQVVAIGLSLLGLVVNPFLMIIGVLVWLAASSERRTSNIKTALTGLSVRDGMITDFKTLSPTDPLSRAIDLTLAGFQQDFPVVEDDHLVGVLSQGDLLRGVASRGREYRVSTAMHDGRATASPTEGLTEAFSRMQGGDGPTLVVVEQGKVVGLLTAGNIAELLAIEAARRGAAPATEGR